MLVLMLFGNDYNVNNDVDGNGDHIDIGNE